MQKLFLLAFFAVIIFSGVSFRNRGVDFSIKNTNQVKTTNGVVEGVLGKSGIRSFKGIPFAAAPVGEWRWREPQPVKNWDTILKADHFGPRAMQTAVFGDMGFRSDGMSEDCLYLNVWT
ncbi:MAG: carboxylesterase family protein, partial [Sphingobacteriales bacterium]